MSNISKKSVAFMIDQLITTSHRCWNFQELIMDESLSEHDRLQAAIGAQHQNAIRAELMRAIDEELGQASISMGVEKSYHTYFNKK